MKRIKRKEDIFYDYFKQFSTKIREAAESYARIVANYPDVGDEISQLKVIENECDELVRAVLAELYNSFITPFDREDISSLVLSMDDIVDGIEKVSARFVLFNVEYVRKGAVEVAQLTLEAAEHLDKLFTLFPEFKKNADEIHRHLGDITEIEDKGDDVYRDALAKIYNKDYEPVEILKWNSLLDKMEDTLDACQEVANIIMGVMMKNA
ncbi:MAG: DUF47 domain-containing protein [Atopobiaceae bacterium]|nr:DUF47 domain-containing protein [Atopobiaceae bacterium]